MRHSLNCDIRVSAFAAARRQSFYSFFVASASLGIYPLSLHDALPICVYPRCADSLLRSAGPESSRAGGEGEDRKSTRLNSSHRCISYAVFCLKKKKQVVN